MTSTRITIDSKDLLTPKQAAQYLGITTMTLWRWNKEGKITPIMLDHAYYHIRELDQVKQQRAKK